MEKKDKQRVKRLYWGQKHQLLCQSPEAAKDWPFLKNGQQKNTVKGFSSGCQQQVDLDDARSLEAKRCGQKRMGQDYCFVNLWRVATPVEEVEAKLVYMFTKC